MNSKISLKNSGIQKTKINTSGILGTFEKQHTKIYSLNHKGMNLTSQNSRSNSKSKISINNINVNAKNLNLNANTLNLSMLKKISHSPKNNFPKFSKKIISNLRNQFNEITHNNAKNEKNYANDFSFNLFYGNKKEIKARTNLNSNEKRKKNKSIPFKFLHTDCDEDFYETDRVSLESLDLEDNQQQILLKEHYSKKKDKNYQEKYKELKKQYNKELSENKRIMGDNLNLKKTVHIFKNIIQIQKEKVDECINKIMIQKNREIEELKNKYENKVNALISENSKLKKLFIEANYYLNLSESQRSKSINRIISNLSQLLTENSYLRKIISNDIQGRVNMKHILTKKIDQLHQRNETKVNLDDDNIVSDLNQSNSSQIDLDDLNTNYSHTQPSMNYTGSFGNSNLYLKKTMKKEVMNNLNILSCEKKKDDIYNIYKSQVLKSKNKGKCNIKINYINKKK